MDVNKVRKITMNLSEREMDVIEDIFFCENTENM